MKDNSDFKYNIETFIGSIKESDKHDWCKAVMRIAWGDNPPTIDIRSVNMSQSRIGKGVSLQNEEADRLVNILLDNDFGSLDSLKEAIKRREDVFTTTNDEIDKMLDDDAEKNISLLTEDTISEAVCDPIHIEIHLDDDEEK